ncbi:MAG: HPP family protein [Candidatus Muiribacteriaceae bacterium]
MKWLDPRYTAHPMSYIFQCFLAMVFIFIMLYNLDFLEHTAIISSFGATSFIVFTMPRRYHSDARRLIGGYITGIVTGVIFHQFAYCTPVMNYIQQPHMCHAIFGSIAVFFAILIMVVFDMEHPPAAGISLGLVMNPFDLKTILFVLASIIFVTIFKHVLKPILIDLV